jgi:UDP-N-acetylglucosamine--N-acetylmuramyl-(pentapeptide) pyrophosphoryl-undecaprenol N-acetylglucosamine transferase
MKTIVLTGGGTAGHVTPNIALIDMLRQKNCRIEYIGSYDGIEKNMIAAIGLSYHAVRSGKLRRYFSWKNFLDPLNLLIGIIQSYFLLRKLKADVVFSKGGFVALPVVVGAWLNRIPVLAHESDMSPGLANRLSFPFVQKICVTFAAAKQHFKQQDKVVITGTPIRESLLRGNVENGLNLCNFDHNKPRLLIMGGGQGSLAINHCVRQVLDKLCEKFQVIHLCGKNKVDHSLENYAGYCQFEYANEELADLFAASDFVISRAGANSLYELLVLQKPHLLIPLSLKASRGDQIQNARFFQKKGVSVVLNEESLTSEALMQALDQLVVQQREIIEKIQALNVQPATQKIVELIYTVA